MDPEILKQIQERRAREAKMKIARTVAADPSVQLSEGAWRDLVTALVQMLDEERKQHNQEVREWQREVNDTARYAAAEARRDERERNDRDY